MTAVQTKKEKVEIAPVGARPAPVRNREGFAKTQGSPDDSKELVAKYAKLHDLSQEQARDYLIYVGYNRRAALERYEPAKKAKKPAKKKAVKKAA